MTRKGLGEFEQQVLLTILRLGGESYSVAIVVEMERRGGGPVSQAAVYIALRRLEERGLVASRIEAAAGSGSGRERRYFRLLPEARVLLRRTRDTLARFWEGLDESLEDA